MFLFNPKTYRSKQNVLIWSAYYWNESKTFCFGPLIIWKKAKQFDFLPKYTLNVHTAGDWKEYALHVQTAGCRNGYTLHGHTAGDRKGIGPARPYCWLRKWIHPSRPYCWWWKGIRRARPNCWLWKGISKRKHKRFDIEPYYRNESKTFWFRLHIIGTKAERFNLFQNCLKSNRNVLATFLSLKTKSERNRVNLLSDRNVSIHLGFRGNKTEHL
jgi:hypothetical protein